MYDMHGVGDESPQGGDAKGSLTMALLLYIYIFIWSFIQQFKSVFFGAAINF